MQRLIFIVIVLIGLGLPFTKIKGALTDAHFPIETYFDPSEIKNANTGSDFSLFSQKEKDALLYLNLARTQPKKFVGFYIDYLKKMDLEGLKAIRRQDKYYCTLKKDLESMSPHSPLAPDENLFKSARIWAKESGTRGVTGHNRTLSRADYSGECCAYSYTDDPLAFVMDLLIDEGIRSLGHRKIMLGDFERVGISIQRHRGYGYCVVLDFK